MNKTTVTFTIAPGGSVNPTSAVTDNRGMVETKVILGSDPGTYTITATANGYSVKATASTNQGGGS